MFGGIAGSQGAAQTDFGEQLLNNAASQSIRRLFSESDTVDVSIRCYPSSKLLQGSVDSVKMQGTGLVIRRQFRVEQMSFETDAIALDFGAVLRGQIRLKQPTQAIAQVTLSEKGINEAFSADLVNAKLKAVELPPESEGAPSRTVRFTDVTLNCLSNNRVRISANVASKDRPTVPIALEVTVGVERRRRLTFTQPNFLADQIPADDQVSAEHLTGVFVEILNNMVDLERFDLDGVDLRINRVETQREQLLLSGYAQINHFPGMA